MSEYRTHLRESVEALRDAAQRVAEALGETAGQDAAGNGSVASADEATGSFREAPTAPAPSPFVVTQAPNVSYSDNFGTHAPSSQPTPSDSQTGSSSPRRWWLNVYEFCDGIRGKTFRTHVVYDSREGADAEQGSNRKACVPVVEASAYDAAVRERDAEYEVRRLVLYALSGQGLPRVLPDKGHGVITDAHQLYERAVAAERERDAMREERDQAIARVNQWVKAAMYSTMPDEFGLTFDPTSPMGWAESRRHVMDTIAAERDAAIRERDLLRERLDAAEGIAAQYAVERDHWKADSLRNEERTTDARRALDAARAELAGARRLTPALVERVAKAVFDADEWRSWNDAPFRAKETYRARARAALLAAGFQEDEA
mgnify:CR=1 FL=1